MSDTHVQDRVVAAAIRRLNAITKATAFDPNNSESKPTAMQQQVIDDFGTIPTQIIVAGNQSGKSQTCARLVAWAAAENNPKWTRPSSWGTESLLILVAGRSGKQIEEAILPKLKSYLISGTYKEVRQGGAIQRLEVDNGNRIVFQSLENPNLARERLQAYVAHIAWIDEQPPTMGIYTELQTRVQSRDGFLLASFTPLVENVDIQKFVDGLKAPFGRKYQFNMLDNPVYTDPNRRAKILAEMALLPESIRNTRLYGAWSSSENAVYHYAPDSMFRELPETYSTGWRHAVAVDPALQSALGLVMAAENPANGEWYLVRAEEISGIADPGDMVYSVEQRLLGYNVFRRTSDPHEAWYINAAKKKGHFYQKIKKDGRKGELIKNTQTALGTRIWLTPGVTELAEDLVQCKWSDRAEEKIVNASKWHRLDALQYLIDNLPKYDGPQHVVESWDQYLYIENQKRKKADAQKAEGRRYKVVGRRYR